MQHNRNLLQDFRNEIQKQTLHIQEPYKSFYTW